MSWKAEYIVLILISTLIDYSVSHLIAKSQDKATKRFLLLISLFSNLGLLFAFKYFNFFSESMRQFLWHFSIKINPHTLKVLLPVGISFYTFQTLSYTIDVYNGRIKPETHLGIFAVFVSFFPQLVAGPIERAGHLLPQFYEEHRFDSELFIAGLRLIIWGFFKKIVIADRLALVVNSIYGDVHSYRGIPLILATVFFAFQIYCDFSGYSDIAIGASKILGFDLMENFRRPYFATSLRDFWSRWHISLSTWFRDYLYFPLGGSRVGRIRSSVNQFIVFVVSGLWHGANWTFLIWGGIHGAVLVISKFLSGVFGGIGMHDVDYSENRIFLFLKIILVFIIVNIGWIFFRASNVSEGIYILKSSMEIFPLQFPGFSVGIVGQWGGFFMCFFSILIMEVVHFLQEFICIDLIRGRFNSITVFFFNSFLIIMILFFGVFSENDFIYFQF